MVFYVQRSNGKVRGVYKGKKLPQKGSRGYYEAKDLKIPIIAELNDHDFDDLQPDDYTYTVVKGPDVGGTREPREEELPQPLPEEEEDRGPCRYILHGGQWWKIC